MKKENSCRMTREVLLGWAYQWEHLWVRSSWAESGMMKQKSEWKAFPSEGTVKTKILRQERLRKRKTDNASEVSTMERWRWGWGQPSSTSSDVVEELGFCFTCTGKLLGGFKLDVAWSDLCFTKKTLAPKWWMDLYYITLIIVIILIIGDESKSKENNQKLFQ